jgi:hypothetical protein
VYNHPNPQGDTEEFTMTDLLTKYKSHLIAIAWVLVVLYFVGAEYKEGWRAMLAAAGMLAAGWVFGSAWTNAKKS